MHTFRKFLALAAASGALLTGAVAADFPKGSPAFETDFEEACKKARLEGKPMLVVFSASWCGPCQMNKQRVYPSAVVRKFHDDFVWVYLDMDIGENSKVARKFGVRGIPHIQFLDKRCDPIGQTVGGTGPIRFAATLKRMLRKAAP